MTRDEFIMLIIQLYPDTFRVQERPEHVKAWIEVYKSALNKKWDYKTLFKIFSTKYKSTVVPPAPSFFYEFKEEVKPRPYSNYIAPPMLTEEQKKAADKALVNLRAKMQEIIKKKTII